MPAPLTTMSICPIAAIASLASAAALRVVANIDGDGDGFATGVAHPRRGVFGGVAAHIGGDDRCARLCQSQRARSTDTRTRAGDDRDAFAQADEFVDGNDRARP